MGMDVCLENGNEEESFKHMLVMSPSRVETM